MARLGAALKGAGLTPSDIAAGDVWLVRNELLFLSADKLSKQSSAAKSRPVVVVQDSKHCCDVTHPVVLAIPISHRVDRANDLSVIIPAGTGGLDVDSIAMPDLVQPILKRDLGKKIGQLPADVMTTLLIRIGVAVGMADLAG